MRNSHLPNALNNSRLTCEEYVAYVSVDVVQNMDAIAWARVDRKTRLPELAQHFELLDDAQPKQCAPQPDVDDDMSATMDTPGLLRKVCFLSTIWQQRFAMRKSLDSAAPTSHMGLVNSSRYSS